jgi:hypothetical protein
VHSGWDHPIGHEPVQAGQDRVRISIAHETSSPFHLCGETGGLDCQVALRIEEARLLEPRAGAPPNLTETLRPPRMARAEPSGTVELKQNTTVGGTQKDFVFSTDSLLHWA